MPTAQDAALGLAHRFACVIDGYDLGSWTKCTGLSVAFKYDKVQVRDANGRIREERAYAITNEKEYFAETTEAFFGMNDVQPFTRDELEKFDPGMFVLLKQVWKVKP